ncbi:MAG: O-antigen ligase family protein [Muribaculaceae bacterium]
MMYKYGADDSFQTTVNASTPFLMLLPSIFITRHKLLSFSAFCICIIFIISSVKRGNIVAAIIPSLLYVLYIFKDSKKSLLNIILVLAGCIVIGLWVNNYVSQNEYFQYRYEATLEGKSSGRDVIYSIMWDLWYNKANDLQKLFGYGFDGTIINNPEGHYAHNDWLEILVDYGIIGIISYIAMFVTLWHVFRKKHGRVCKTVFFSIFTILGIKSTVSMCFTNEYTLLLSIPYAFVLGNSYEAMYNKSTIINGRNSENHQTSPIL